METLDKQYWNNRYEEGQTGWDLGAVSPPLKAYIDQLTDKSLAILIPGCGNAYEAAYLLENGFTNVTVIDISSHLTESLGQQLQSFVDSGYLNIICGDFFAHEAQYDLILEQTFFCAIDPSMRGKYAMQCASLLKPGGKVAGVLFNRMFEGGPPFGGSVEEYEEYFLPMFSKVKIEPCYNSVKPRAGAEVFIILDK